MLLGVKDPPGIESIKIAKICYGTNSTGAKEDELYGMSGKQGRLHGIGGI